MTGLCSQNEYISKMNVVKMTVYVFILTTGMQSKSWHSEFNEFECSHFEYIHFDYITNANHEDKNHIHYDYFFVNNLKFLIF